MDAVHSSGAAAAPGKKPNLLRVSVATVVGTAVEAFDFLAYGTAAALVFNKLFFPQFDPLTGTLAAFAAFASGMLARPVGGILFGHFGDRVGRKSMLTFSLLMMGICTVLIGLLPTYEQIGVWAPILLVALRIGQGLSFGGEMGGAMLMAVEHAPPRWKALFGSLPLVGAPLGILMSVGAFALVTRLPEEDFLSWGWRLPFLASAVLIVVGVLIRRGIDESPDFARVKAERTQVKLPIVELLRRHGRALLLCIGCKLAEVTLIYTFLVFSVSYAVSNLGFSRSDALHALLYGAAVLTFTIPLFGLLGDRYGARRVCGWGGILLAVMAIPIFMAVGSGSLMAYGIAVFIAMALNYAMMIAPQSSLYAAQFPPELRYSGLSIGVQFSAAIGGGLAPMVSAMLVARFDSIVPVGAYLAVLGLIAGTSAFLMRPAGQERRAA
ncbi:transporter [Bordetella trematum]|uniref:Integral membrane transport protein n=1 Tax=Bordetella trematum TaxID=123899 RepID=A0A157PF97_9BORD|nr:MFS transporter [Bordetella trematum]AZR92875.1 transporter [Bordetella trematum]NNH19686.1 MHS family MFS transporter [Bordetella trematum]QIM71484.1 MFS transporter [Bordetella trematum]SAI32295.1 integral membrane transport protein [Bordetella trematum]SAI47890.1 integral membrane transport protein [Bordetella trematum]